MPGLVDLHNYIASSNTQQKKANWFMLNKKVLNKLGYDLTDEEIDNLVSSKTNYIESLLKRIYDLVRLIIYINFRLKLIMIQTKRQLSRKK